MRVFIGSSTQGAKSTTGPSDMDLVANLLQSAGANTIPWNREGSFKPSFATLESLINILGEVNAGAFIFREDDTVIIGDEKLSTTRDNVILEFGLFCGAKGRENAAIFRRGTPRMPSDLGGVTVVVLEDIERAQQDAEQWVKRIRNSLSFPMNLGPEHIAAAADGLLKAGVSPNQLYPLMSKWGVSPPHLDRVLAAKRS